MWLRVGTSVSRETERAMWHSVPKRVRVLMAMVSERSNIPEMALCAGWTESAPDERKGIEGRMRDLVHAIDAGKEEVVES